MTSRRLRSVNIEFCVLQDDGHCDFCDHVLCARLLSQIFAAALQGGF